MEKVQVEDARWKKEEIQELQQRSRGMLRIVAAGSSGRSTAVQAPEETQSEVKLLRAELQDQMARYKRELAFCKKSVHELSIERTKSEASMSLAHEAASENKLAERSCQMRWQSEHRIWSEERRRLKTAHQRHLQEELDKFEQFRHRMSQEMASSRRKLEGEVREARQRQRTVEGKLKHMEEAEEARALTAGEVAEAQMLEENEVQHLRELLRQSQDEVLAQQADARRQTGAASKLQDAFRLELVAAASAREALVGDWHSQKRQLLQAMAVDRRAQEEVTDREAALAEKAAFVAAERALEVRRLQGLREEDRIESQRLREDLAAALDAAKHARLLQSASADVRKLDSELSWQKEMREEDMAQLHSACEESLEGLPLEFYQELRSQSGDDDRVPTVTRYGHILQAVGGCVKTLLRENMQLQEAQRSTLGAPSLTQSSDSALSLGNLALTPLSSCAFDQDSSLDGRGQDRKKTLSPMARRAHDRRSDAPELSRQVFAAHRELAHSREEVRQFMVQRDLEREMNARKSSLEGMRTQELSDQNKEYLAEIKVLQEEVRSRQEYCDLNPPVTGRAAPGTAGLVGEDVRTRSTGHDGRNPASLSVAGSWQGAAQVPANVRLSPARACDEIPKPRWRRDWSGRESPETEKPVDKSANGVPPSWRNRAKHEPLHTIDDEDRTDGLQAEMARGVNATTLYKAFSCAEQLCERQHYRDALPLLQEVAQYGDGNPEIFGATMRLSDVWAYIGVASQAEGLTEQSVESYRKAIREDPCLHVCHANLASLLSFQDEHTEADHHMSMALAIDPQNQAYAKLALELRSAQASSG